MTSSADVILALGTRFADETTCSYKDGTAFSFPGTKLIHVDIDAGEIGKNYGCDIGIIGDLSIVLEQLIIEYKRTVSSDRTKYLGNQYTEEILELKKDWAQVLQHKRDKKFENVTISQVIGIMNDCLPDNTIIATSSGNTQAQLFQEYCFKNGQVHLTTGGFSTMGWAVPAAMGAKLAKPNVPVVALVGDGDFMMTMQELSTMAQYDIPVVVILVNNSGWMAIKDLQADMLGKENMFGNDWIRKGEIYSPDFCAIAQAFGIYSEKISKEEEVAGAIKRAIELKQPALIQIDVYREYPESGGEAYGWWDVPIPGYLEERRQQYEKAVLGSVFKRDDRAMVSEGQ